MTYAHQPFILLLLALRLKALLRKIVTRDLTSVIRNQGSRPLREMRILSHH